MKMQLTIEVQVKEDDLNRTKNSFDSFDLNQPIEVKALEFMGVTDYGNPMSIVFGNALLKSVKAEYTQPRFKRIWGEK